MAFIDDIAADSPRVWWRLGDASYGIGTMLDASGNGYHAAYFNGAFLASVDGLITGDGSQATAFDRANATYGRLAGGSIADLAAWTAATLEVVVEVPPLTGTPQIFAAICPAKSGAYGAMSLYILASNGKPTAIVNKTTVLQGPDSIVGSGPHHLAITYTAGVATLFVDGAPVDSVSGLPANLKMTGYTGTVPPSFDMLYVGASNFTDPGGFAATSGYYDGTLDEITIYDYALAPARIAVHAAHVASVVQTPVSFRAYLEVDTRTRPNARSYLKVNTSAPVSARSYLRVDTTRVRARSYLKVNTRAPVASRSYLAADTATDFSVAQRPGVAWSARLLIGGIDYTHLLTGAFRTDWAKGRNFVASFDLKPDTGVLDPATFDREPVILEYRDHVSPGGPIQYALKRYVGTVSGTTWLPARGILSCNATSNSDARFKFMEQAVVGREIGGEWSPYVFNESARGWDHARDRLETLQADLWFRPDGGVMFVPWVSDSPRVEWQDGAVLLQPLRHQPALRSRITNRIEVRLDYRFQRLRQRMIRCHWSTGVPWCDRLLNPFPLCQRSMIESAARGAGGWQLIGNVAFDPVPRAQPYRCALNANSGSNYIVWKGDTAEAWAWGAWWTVARRWAQPITERYAVEVVAQASVDANGVIEQVDEFGIESEKDNSDWLDERGYSIAGDGFVVAAGSGGANNGASVVLGDQVKPADDDGPGNRDDFEQAQKAAFAAAAAEIIASHREIVTVANLFDPRVKPGITQRVNMAKLRATGRVIGLREVFDVAAGRATTEVDIGSFVVAGSGLADASPIEPVEQPQTPAETDIPDRLYFPTRIGGRTNSPFFNESWAGYTTNYEYDPTQQDPFAADPAEIGDRAYPNRFTVEYPAIPAQHLQAIELQAARRIDVVIPSDELVRIQ